MFRISTHARSKRPSSCADRQASAGRLRLLTVADDWLPRRGGISTINLNLCRALAALGHNVRCLLPSGSVDDDAHAKARGVNLVLAKACPGYIGMEMISALSERSAPRLKLDAVIGHDHVSGREARRLASEIWRVPYVHLVHTLPGECEPYKRGRGMADASNKADEQLALCRAADLVVGIGPRIAEYLCARLPVQNVFQLDPGLDPDVRIIRRPDPWNAESRVVWMGRTEHGSLKGVDVVVELARLLSAERLPGGRSIRFVLCGVEEVSEAEIRGRFLDAGVKLCDYELVPYNPDRKFVEQQLGSASLALMPSKAEPFGLVGLKAIATGTPAIVSADSGLGMFLHRLAADRRIDLPQGSVLDVLDDPGKTAELWLPVVLDRLCQRPEAFREAVRLRVRLAACVSWERSVAALVDRLQKFRTGRNTAPMPHRPAA